MSSRSICLLSHASAVFLVFFTLFNNSYAQSFKQTGIASFYADKFEGRTTANGEKYRHSKLTAAHKTLPFGTIVRVKNLENDKEVTVRVNDRGPFVEGRIIDLSKSAAEKLDFINKGIVKVEIISVQDSEPTKTPYSTLDRPPEEIVPANKSYYSLSVTKQRVQGFGVQIGSFKEMVNLVELADNLRGSYKNNVYTQVVDIKGVKNYKLIVGNVKNRDKADKLRQKVVKSYPDCFVIKF
jgi:rare lipoprotein A